MYLSLSIVLLLLALVGVVLRKTYFALPISELKRRAAGHDQSAKQLHRAVAHGANLRSLLWLYIGLTSAGSFVTLARQLPVWASLLIVGPLIWIVFSLIPASQPTGWGLSLTSFVTPFVTWLLNLLQPGLDVISNLVEKVYSRSRHTGLFEGEDLVRLLDRQKNQPDNRFSDEELKAVKNVLKFNNQKVADTLTTTSRVKSVLADDTAGPVLIDELHQAGQPFALVRESAKGPVIGILAVSQLGIDSNGRVADLMYQPVHYLHEDDSLAEALHAFSVTHQPAFVVVNSSEEYAGIISVEAVIRQLLSELPDSGLETYTDSMAVANRYNQTPVKTDEEVIE